MFIQDIPKFSCNVKAIFSQKRKKIHAFCNNRHSSQNAPLHQAIFAQICHTALLFVLSRCSLVHISKKSLCCLTSVFCIIRVQIRKKMNNFLHFYNSACPQLSVYDGRHRIFKFRFIDQPVVIARRRSRRGNLLQLPIFLEIPTSV